MKLKNQLDKHKLNIPMLSINKFEISSRKFDNLYVRNQKVTINYLENNRLGMIKLEM